MSSQEEQPVVETPTAADMDSLIHLFEVDLASLDIHPTPEDLRATVQHLVNAPDNESYMRVVRETLDGPAVGLLVAHRWHSVTFAGPSFWLESLYVDPTIRRKGLGRALVEDLLQFSRANGIRGIDLEAYRMNAPAGYLYRSFGFRRLGRERYSLAIE